MRSQTTCNVSLFSSVSVYTLTAGLSEIDCVLAPCVQSVLGVVGFSPIHLIRILLIEVIKMAYQVRNLDHFLKFRLTGF